MARWCAHLKAYPNRTCGRSGVSYLYSARGAYYFAEIINQAASSYGQEVRESFEARNSQGKILLHEAIYRAETGRAAAVYGVSTPNEIA